ncbi:S8 family serine peptidase [Rubrivivax gelatinosus]|uniref:Serine protease n=1 Tax=Rubrivivax gelatinosus TaxID=28068 RepID=A0ABS1E1Q8_RUBGE|nr:S8 family serine peptidase [Rubrivivax gelatinosus]MBK1715683.1 serine protease [Rubrivivax gelatinosus]
MQQLSRSGAHAAAASTRRLVRGLAIFAFSSTAFAAAATEADEPGRIVVRYKPTLQAASATDAADTMSRRVTALSRRVGVKLGTLRSQGTQAAVYSAPAGLGALQLRALATQIAQDPSVASAEPDVRVSASSNDTYFAQQWALGSPAARAGGANFVAAWPYSTGSDVVVAVLDTGMTAHPDLSGRQFAGYDFVSDAGIGADGGGRDADPSDPGDACAAAGSSSSWHGTAVASQIAAIADNGYGIAGGAPGARVLQVRVLGKCGGWLSDTADAIAWVAGRSFAGVPAPSVKARVINLSLGGATSCPSYMQDAINLANAAGITVIAAAGNDGRAAISSPSNCSGVIAVAAATATGDLATYSNYSSQVAITAPGGGSCRQATAGCDTTPTIASGVEGANSFVGYSPARYFAGTSAATPQVAAAAALLLSYSPSLTPAQLRSALLSGVHAFPAGTFCTVAGRCGAGLLDAAGALATLSAPLVTITPTAGVTTGVDGVQAGLVARGASATLKATVASGTGYSYAWQQASGTAATIVSGRSSDTLVITAPASAGTMSFTVTASSAGGVSARNSVSLRVNSVPETLPAALPEAVAGASYTTALPTLDGDGDTVSYALVSGPTGLTVSSGGAVAWSAPVQGGYTLTIAARDPYGQTFKRSVTLTVKAKATVKPPVVPGGTLTASAGKAFSAATNVSGPAGVAISYALAGQPAGLTINTSGVLNWAAPVVGSYSIRVSASNAGGSASGVYALTVKAANRAPVVTAKTYPASAGVAWSGQVVASDADGDALKYAAASALPAGLTIEASGRMSWAKPVAGNYGFSVRVTDAAGLSGVATMTVAVAMPNRAPVVAALSYIGIAGVKWIGQVAASDADRDALRYELIAGVPAGLAINSAGLMSWASPVAGSYAISVRAIDTKGASAVAVMRLVVGKPNSAPTLDGRNFSASANVAFAAQLQARDVDGDKLSYALSGGVPAGLTLNTAGRLSWTKPPRGSWTVTVRVTDARGAVLTTTLTIVVK